MKFVAETELPPDVVLLTRDGKSEFQEMTNDHANGHPTGRTLRFYLRPDAEEGSLADFAVVVKGVAA